MNTKILHDPSVLASALICGLGLGGFLLWSSIVPLAEGVIVTGYVVVKDNKKVVQHLEGGVIENLLVKEGDQVNKGDVLVRLNGIRAQARRDRAAQDIVSLMASKDRLSALALGREEIDFTAVDGYQLDASDTVQIQLRQTELFETQQASLRSQADLLTTRKNSLEQSAKDAQVQIDALKKSVELAAQELKLKNGLRKQKLIRVDLLQQLEREQAVLTSNYAQALSQKQQSLAEAIETEKQIIQTRASFNESVSIDLVAAEQQLLAALEKYDTDSDVLSRIDIVAPQSGKILNMQFSTKGGVVAPGDTIMEIVPQNTEHVAQVRISPSERDSIHENLPVMVTLSAYKQWRVPQISGKVLSVSADLKTSATTGEPYYESRILLNSEELSGDVNVIPGMPVDAFIASGNERTFVDYLLEPISGALTRGTTFN